MSQNKGKHNFSIKKRNYRKETYYRNKKIIDNYKQLHPCNCGENDINCLEFHHRDPSNKIFDIYSKGKETSIKKLKAEIEKCDIVCKNCHTKIHNKNRRYNSFEPLIEKINLELSKKISKLKRRRLHNKKQKYMVKIYIRDYKNKYNCEICNENNNECLIFHHRDKTDKEEKVPRLCCYGIRKVKEEINKCSIICHNCHSKIHNS